jgi:hypothetical protein
LKEIKHAARLSREIKGWKETEHSEWGGKKGKKNNVVETKNQNLISVRI